jgi:hypothetical protein
MFGAINHEMSEYYVLVSMLMARNGGEVSALVCVGGGYNGYKELSRPYSLSGHKYRCTDTKEFRQLTR